MTSSTLKMLKTTGNNEHSDDYYTAQEVLLPLLPYLNNTTVYYDCTSGISGSIVDYLNEKGFTCKASDSRDFLTDTFNDFDCVITNPPYSKKDKFLKKCYSLGKHFALLLPADPTGKGSPHFGVVWFCKDMYQNN